VDGEGFRTSIRHGLVPRKPEDGVALDNLPAHKVMGIREAITAQHAEFYYCYHTSPDMNPNRDGAFAKLKALLHQDQARTINGLTERICHLLDRFLPIESSNFRHATGYRRSF
jgi:hypothetical protein